MYYDHKSIENKWQKYWQEEKIFSPQPPKGEQNSSDEINKKSPLRGLGAYYVLDMFPYPSGAGLHVGHPLGYIASDIMARFKRHQGYNVLHPIGYDSFGLPAEQYAIQTGQHPAVTTETNIKGGTDKQGNNIPGYENQLKKLGLSFDWDREIWTSDPSYYKWTQWIFIELFHSWYNKSADKAEPISTLIEHFEKFGTENLDASQTDPLNFTAEEWQNASEADQQDILLNYRLAFRAETTVNWCPALGTVLANDEVKDGKSERGGYPVFQKKMMQWSMRISAYSERLLQGLKTLDWPQPLKDSQEYWIGKSVGAEVEFPVLTPALSKGEGAETSNVNGGGTKYSKEEINTSANKKRHYMTGGGNSNILLQHAKNMRHEPTEAEDALWQALRNRNLGEKFRRQHLVGDFIVDFVCLDKNLVIEVDGGYHLTADQKELDRQRTKLLELNGFKEVRFTNDEVLQNLPEVLEKINTALKRSLSIGESLIKDNLAPSPLERAGVRIFTTRPDTIFGATFVVLAPENPLVAEITTDEQKSEVENYIAETAKKTERDRMADVKNVSGAFTGSYAVNPFTQKNIPIYISDYVLMGYGTGAVMAVPAHDERDHRFAKKFGLEIMNVIKNDKDINEESYDSKDSVCVNSEFLDGLNYNEAKAKIIAEIEKMGIGHGTTNYRQRDAIFSRQRYWGEPVPVYYRNGLPYTLPASALPLELPEVEKYLPTEDGDPPLGNAKNWYWLPDDEKYTDGKIVSKEEWEASPLKDFGGALELSTMPGWAGSSWYFLRYMDPKNDEVFVDKKLADYWGQVDLYIGGSEHATGHLLYSRFWNMFLKDRGYIEQEEPFKKLINQGMILGMSAYLYRLDFKHSLTVNSKVFNELKERFEYVGGDFNIPIPNIFISADCLNDLDKIQQAIQKANQIMIDQGFPGTLTFFNTTQRIPVEVLCVENDYLLTDNFKVESRIGDEFSLFVINDKGKYIVEREVEKMSKSKYNVVNPDDICEEYGADCLRLYEMFLGPLEQSKPWNTQGLSGVYGFLKKFYNLYFNGDNFEISEEEPTKTEYKILHTLIKKVLYDLEHFSFNTSVSQFMIAVNEFQKLKTNKRKILEPLAVVISPYAPHICEELWQKLGHEESIEYAPFPDFDETHLTEDEFEYPVSVNGKMKFKLKLPSSLAINEIEEMMQEDERVKNLLKEITPKKIIIVPKKIINIAY